MSQPLNNQEEKKNENEEEENVFNIRCQYINDDFSFCTNRRLSNNNYCLEHYLNRNRNSRIRRRVIDDNEPVIAPRPDSRIRRVFNLNNVNEEQTEVQPVIAPRPNSILNLNNVVVPQLELNFPQDSVESNQEQNRLEDIPPPLVRQDAVVIESNDLIGRIDNIIHNNNSNISNLSEIIRTRAISSRNRYRRIRPIQPEIQENSEYNFCLLCDNFVVNPHVELKCKHKYHLNCFIIDNSNEKHEIELKEKCSKCDKKINYEQEEYDCAICLEKIIDHKVLSNLPCEHKFHLLCIEQWKVMNKNTCPLCRTEF